MRNAYNNTMQSCDKNPTIIVVFWISSSESDLLPRKRGYLMDGSFLAPKSLLTYDRFIPVSQVAISLVSGAVYPWIYENVINV
jgi:hypothetical protein